MARGKLGSTSKVMHPSCCEMILLSILRINVVIRETLSELKMNDLQETLVDQMPILSQIHRAKTVLMTTVCVVERFILDAGLGIDHDALRRKRVGNLDVLLVIDITGYL